jgi:hypothetical protein
MAEEAISVVGDKRIEDQVKDQKHRHKKDGFYDAAPGSALDEAAPAAHSLSTIICRVTKFRAFGCRKGNIEALPTSAAAISLLITPPAKKFVLSGSLRRTNVGTLTNGTGSRVCNNFAHG